MIRERHTLRGIGGVDCSTEVPKNWDVEFSGGSELPMNCISFTFPAAVTTGVVFWAQASSPLNSNCGS